MTATKKQKTRWLCRNCEQITTNPKEPLRQCPSCGSTDLVQLWRRVKGETA